MSLQSSMDQAAHLALFQKLTEQKVRFVIEPVMGEPLELTPAELVNFVHDPDSCIAQHYEVTVEHYRAWKAFIDGIWGVAAAGQAPPCDAINRNGQPCRSLAVPDHYWHLRPDEFVVGQKVYCGTHRQLLSQGKIAVLPRAS